MIIDVAVRLDRLSIPEPNSGCYIWLGAVKNSGYGAFKIGNANTNAHRAAYEYYKGCIPDGFEVDHICNNKLCINTDHMQICTHKQNTGFRHARKYGNFCKSGHEYTEANTQLRKDGSKHCRNCANMAWRLNYHRKKANG